MARADSGDGGLGKLIVLTQESAREQGTSDCHGAMDASDSSQRPLQTRLPKSKAMSSEQEQLLERWVREISPSEESVRARDPCPVFDAFWLIRSWHRSRPSTG